MMELEEQSDSFGVSAAFSVRQLGYDKLRELQVEVIRPLVIAGRDVFGILPTGYGKSLCFACLPLLFDHLLQLHDPFKSIVIVVTPLTAIMEDQVVSLSGKGLSVAAVNSNTSTAVKKDVCSGRFSLVFFTPELLLQERRWRELLTSTQYVERVKAFVVDEAHCIKKWGETFRGLLLRVGEIRSVLPPGVPMMALTATASRTLQRKVTMILGMKKPVVVAVSPSKPNLMYAIATTAHKSLKDAFQPLLARLRCERVAMPRVIIYCRRIEECADLYIFFRTALGGGFTEPANSPDVYKLRLVDMFTSVTDSEVKTHIVNSFHNPLAPLRIVCATIAFGMGIDCPDVREIIHFGVSDDTESFIQETGRAGRDGKPALSLLVPTTVATRKADKRMTDYQNNQSICRRDFLFGDMDNYAHTDCGKCLCCDICARNCDCGSCNDKISSFVFL